MRNDKIIIPSSLYARAIESAHEGHQYTTKTLQLLRQTCWFPGMNKLVGDYVSSCLACNAASHHNPPVPLEPNFLPDRPWQKLHADFKGPIAGSYYAHIFIDQYSKYPEVDIVKSTSFKKLKPAMDRVFATHGIPETLSTDNGPPYSGDEFKAYAKRLGFELTPVTPDDPQSNGFAENFVKSICKLIHTAAAENKDPKEELYTFLLQYRATPHSTTELSPAEMLFGRKINTKLPHVHSGEETKQQKQTRIIHDNKKIQQKHAFDKRHNAKLKSIVQGDQVLLKQRKSTTQPPYNPQPFVVTKVEGNRLTLKNGRTTRIRDKNKVKVIPQRSPIFHSKTPVPTVSTKSDTDI